MSVEGHPSITPAHHRSLLFLGILRLTSSLRTAFRSFLRFQIETDRHNQGRIIVSAEQCALRRAQETERPDALFQDVFAKVLAGGSVKQHGGALGKNLSLQNRISIRTKYFDDFIERNLNESQPCQLVSLGAGMDMRPYRLECITSLVSCYEVDLVDVIKTKGDRLARVQPAPRLRAASLIRIGSSLLSNQWVEELLKAGFDTKNVRTIWVMEGIVYYFADDEVKDLFRKVHTLSSPGSVFCASVLKDPPRNRRGPAFRSYIPDPERYFREGGFRLIAADLCGGPAANYGRWKAERSSGTYYVSGIKPVA